MERSKQRSALVNFLLALGIAIAAYLVARMANTLAGTVAVVFLALGAFVAAVSWFQMRLEDRERIEKLDLDELARSRGGSTLFESKESELFPAARSREQFERFLVPICTVIVCLVQLGGAVLLWRWLSASAAVAAVKQPTIALAMFGVFAFLLFIRGIFSANIARLENQPLLRPSASYLLLGAYLSVLVVLGIIGVQLEYPRTDYYIARILCVMLGLVGLETVINLVLEMYRPRVKGKAGRPLYESRLVGLLGQPEGLITTAAEALDYQFGFKVSETWFYRLFFERALAWIVLLLVGSMILSGMCVFIEAGEQGLLEHFGKPVKILDAGAHPKYPWPIDKVYRFRTEQIQSFNVGVTNEESRLEEPIVLWTVAHAKEDNFLVAIRDNISLESTNQSSSKRVPVNLLTGTIPVQFQITNLAYWAYKNEDAPSLLQDLAEREVIRYLASADMNEILSQGRLEASEAMLNRIQAAANLHNLGSRIISVGLQDLHPPVKVGPEYEKVIAAIHTKQARILAAEADAIRTNTLAGARAESVVNQASADGTYLKTLALAQAAIFTNQITAYLGAPSVYAPRAYLQTFVRATANSRKYVLLTTNTEDILTFDLQDQLRADLLQMNVTPKK
jgi:membrane protease subunit HflK